MDKIRTTLKRGEESAAYVVAVPLHAKKNETLFPAVCLSPRKVRSSHQGRVAESRSLRNAPNSTSRVAAFLLIGFFFFNPFLDVYADELLSVSSEVPPPVILQEPIIPPTITSEDVSAPEIPESLPETPATIMANENIEVLTGEHTLVSPEVLSQEEITPELIPVSEGAASDAIEATTTDEIISHEEVVATSTEKEYFEKLAASTSEPILSVPAHGADVPEDPSDNSNTDEESETIEESEQSVSEGENIAAVTPVQITNVVERKYLFKENECTRLEDGGFYCAPPEMLGRTDASNISLPRVYTESDGDKEIFFEDAGGKIKITDNTYDDDAPVYDKQSDLILWHALIRGRFQIMAYDRKASTTKQLTSTEQNNTDPKVRGKSAVWQGWVNNNWEVFYIEDLTAEPLKIEQITANEQPDMFPIISDSFITWQAFFGGSWHVFVYSIENGQISQISQPEEGRYENPRFALLFENRKENGEVETVGYDVASGKEIPINAPQVPPPPPSQGREEDKAVPVPAGQTSTSTAPLKNPGKDDENHEP